MATTTIRALTRTLLKGDLSYIRDDSTIADAAERLAREDIGALPVYDKNYHLKGMITDRDIVVNVVAGRKDPEQTRVGEVANTSK